MEDYLEEEVEQNDQETRVRWSLFQLKLAIIVFPVAILWKIKLMKKK